jgi:hypothetical protein
MIYIVTVGKTAYSKTERKEVEVDALNVTDAMLIARKQNPDLYVFEIKKKEEET